MDSRPFGRKALTSVLHSDKADKVAAGPVARGRFILSLLPCILFDDYIVNRSSFNDY